MWAVPSVFQKFMLLFPQNRKQEFLKAPVTDNFIGGYMTEDKEILQWHPAFFAGIQIELAEEADELVSVPFVVVAVEVVVVAEVADVTVVAAS